MCNEVALETKDHPLFYHPFYACRKYIFPWWNHQKCWEITWIAYITLICYLGWIVSFDYFVLFSNVQISCRFCIIMPRICKRWSRVLLFSVHEKLDFIKYRAQISMHFGTNRHEFTYIVISIGTPYLKDGAYIIATRNNRTLTYISFSKIQVYLTTLPFHRRIRGCIKSLKKS
jgi:hypothetical protein